MAASRKRKGKKGRKGKATKGKRTCVKVVCCKGKPPRKLCYGVTRKGNWGIVKNTPA